MTASSDPETYGKLTTYVVEESDGRSARRAVARGQQRRVDRGDLATDLARQRRRRRIAGAVRRPADHPGRRRPDLRPAVLRVGAPEFGLGQHGDRVPVGDRVVQRSCRARTHAGGGAGAAVPGLRGRDRRSGRHSRPNRPTDDGSSPTDRPTTDRPTHPATDELEPARRSTPRSCSTRPMHSSTRPTRRSRTATSARTRTRSTRPGRSISEARPAPRRTP